MSLCATAGRVHHGGNGSRSKIIAKCRVLAPLAIGRARMLQNLRRGARGAILAAIIGVLCCAHQGGAVSGVPHPSAGWNVLAAGWTRRLHGGWSSGWTDKVCKNTDTSNNKSFCLRHAGKGLAWDDATGRCGKVGSPFASPESTPNPQRYATATIAGWCKAHCLEMDGCRFVSVPAMPKNQHNSLMNMGGCDSSVKGFHPQHCNHAEKRALPGWGSQNGVENWCEFATECDEFDTFAGLVAYMHLQPTASCADVEYDTARNSGWFVGTCANGGYVLGKTSADVDSNKCDCWDAKSHDPLTTMGQCEIGSPLTNKYWADDEGTKCRDFAD